MVNNDRLQEVRGKLAASRAIRFDPESGMDEWAMCEEMIKISQQNGGVPVKLEGDDKGFQVTGDVSVYDAYSAYYDQQYAEQFRGHELELLNEEAEVCCDSVYRGEDKDIEVKRFKMVEALVARNPDEARQIDTITLAKTYWTLPEQASPEFKQILGESLDKYMQGQETFPPTIYNASAVQFIDPLLRKRGYTDESIDARAQQVQKDMLKGLDFARERTIWWDEKDFAFIERVALQFPNDQQAQEKLKQCRACKTAQDVRRGKGPKQQGD